MENYHYIWNFWQTLFFLIVLYFLIAEILKSIIRIIDGRKSKFYKWLVGSMGKEKLDHYYYVHLEAAALTYHGIPYYRLEGFYRLSKNRWTRREL